MQDVYLIPGLGADKRVFDFLDLAPYPCQYITWLDPQVGETIEHYANRLSEQIKSATPVLIGVSFGGLVAIEIAKQRSTQQVILISSARTNAEIPAYIRLLGRLNLHKVFPTRFLKSSIEPAYYFFGVSTPSDKELLRNIINDTDPRFLTWAIEKIVHWKNSVIPANTTLIHGSADRIFTRSKGDYVIRKGGHFMIVNRAPEISTLLKQLLIKK